MLKLLFWQSGKQVTKAGDTAETYRVEVKRHPETKKRISETWYLGDKISRADGPAHREWHYKTGVCTLERYYQDGKRHRTDGPAEIMMDPITTKPIKIFWYLDGTIAREDDKPAITVIDHASGHIVDEVFCDWSGNKSRENGPARISYCKRTGKKLSETWYLHGTKHRDSVGPTHTNYSMKTGKVVREEYTHLGVKHRDKGPAVIHYHPRTSKITRTDYYRQGKQVSLSQGQHRNP